MKILDKEMQDTIVENSNIMNSARIITGLKEDRTTLEDSFIEIVQSLNIEAFVFARKMKSKEGLKIVLSNGIRVRNWDAFLKIIHENEDYIEIFAESQHLNDLEIEIIENDYLMKDTINE